MTNTGAIAFEMVGVNVGWYVLDPWVFAIDQGSCGLAKLMPGESCSVEVTFNPSSPGAKQGFISLTNTFPPVEGASSELSGTGLGADESPPPPVSDTRARVVLTRGPRHRTTSRDAAFWFRSEPAAKTICRLDNGAWTSCRSPRRFKHLEPGRHHMRIRSIDALSVLGPVAHHRWTIRTPR